MLYTSLLVAAGNVAVTASLPVDGIIPLYVVLPENIGLLDVNVYTAPASPATVYVLESPDSGITELSIE